MTDEELVRAISSILIEDLDGGEVTVWEQEFIESMYVKEATQRWVLTSKQRAVAEALLVKLEQHSSAGGGDVRIIPPPGAEKYFREKKPWED